jgi:hypothetical protein
MFIMTPDEFRASLATLRWSTRRCAEMINCDDRLVRRWASGAVPIPPSVGVWLAGLVDFHNAHPAPQDWRKRHSTEASTNAMADDVDL